MLFVMDIIQKRFGYVFLKHDRGNAPSFEKGAQTDPLEGSACLQIVIF